MRRDTAHKKITTFNRTIKGSQFGTEPRPSGKNCQFVIKSVLQNIVTCFLVKLGRDNLMRKVKFEMDEDFVEILPFALVVSDRSGELDD